MSLWKFLPFSNDLHACRPHRDKLLKSFSLMLSDPLETSRARHDIANQDTRKYTRSSHLQST